MYSLKNLSASYGKKSVLKNLSLDIPPGLVSLIGPNGSGKSTLLRVLAGLMAYSGNVLLHGREVMRFSRREFSRNAAFVMSCNNFRPSYPFSVREIIEMGRLPYRGIFTRLTRSDIGAVNQSAEILGINNLLERDIMTLSDGERQLALIACSLAQSTRIILLDEPTSALDPDKAAKVFALLRRLADDGRSIIAAVHDINLSLSYSDYYIALRGGELISHGPEISAQVLHDLYRAKFIPYHNKERNDSMWRALPQ